MFTKDLFQNKFIYDLLVTIYYIYIYGAAKKFSVKMVSRVKTVLDPWCRPSQESSSGGNEIRFKKTELIVKKSYWFSH